jgi:hypothetical protein
MPDFNVAPTRTASTEQPCTTLSIRSKVWTLEKVDKFAANGTSGCICQSAKGFHPYEQVAAKWPGATWRIRRHNVAEWRDGPPMCRVVEVTQRQPNGMGGRCGQHGGVLLLLLMVDLGDMRKPRFDYSNREFLGIIRISHFMR